MSERDPLTAPVRGDVISYRVEADDMFSAGTCVLVVVETRGRWVSARGLKLFADGAHEALEHGGYIDGWRDWSRCLDVTVLRRGDA